MLPSVFAYIDEYPVATILRRSDIDAPLGAEEVLGRLIDRIRSRWCRSRRIVGTAEWLEKGSNPRFVVTSLPATEYEKRYLYEESYCARGEMENRIKEHQLDLFGDRASCSRFRTNSIRGLFSMAAQLLVVELRRYFHGTELERAQAGTIRERLMKIGTLVSVSVRRVYLRFSSAFPRAHLFIQLMQRLRSPPLTLAA